LPPSVCKLALKSIHYFMSERNEWRADSGEAYTAANLPALLPPPLLAPAAGDRIRFSGGVLSIPE